MMVILDTTLSRHLNFDFITMFNIMLGLYTMYIPYLLFTFYLSFFFVCNMPPKDYHKVLK
jgi:hypothetical protein